MRRWQGVRASGFTVATIQEQSTAEFSRLQISIGIAIASVVLIGLLTAIYVRYNNVYGGKFIALDMLFRLSHFTAAGQQVTAYKSCLGVVFTATTVIVAGLAGYLYALLCRFTILVFFF